MSTAALLRHQIEATLANRIPSALTPPPRVIRPTVSSGVQEVDQLLQGGLPLGAISEIVGLECSGRTSLAMHFVAEMTQAGKVCAWVDVSDALQPESAAAIGVALTHLLWVRCGVTEAREAKPLQRDFRLPEKYLVPRPIKKGLHGGGFGPHPRTETKGLSNSIGELWRSQAIGPRCTESQQKPRPERLTYEPRPTQVQTSGKQTIVRDKPWSRLDQALRVTDLLLQAGGFSAIVLDMGSIAPEHASRVPLATWFRYRAAAEHTQACVQLLTQHACAKSSAGLVLHLKSETMQMTEPTVFTGIEHHAAVARQRFIQTTTNVIPLRKPPQSERSAQWQSRTTWAGRR